MITASPLDFHVSTNYLLLSSTIHLVNYILKIKNKKRNKRHQEIGINVLAGATISGPGHVLYRICRPVAVRLVSSRTQTPLRGVQLLVQVGLQPGVEMSHVCVHTSLLSNKIKPWVSSLRIECISSDLPHSIGPQDVTPTNTKSFPVFFTTGPPLSPPQLS